MDEYMATNRKLWDAWTKIHLDSEFYDVASFRNGERPIRIRDYEREEIGDVAGRTLLHLQCHFGLDTLSWARLEATVTGTDFSPEAIAAAHRLAADLGIPATFICANLYELPVVLDAGEGFDVVYTSGGVIGWLPDIDGWARVVAHSSSPAACSTSQRGIRWRWHSRTKVCSPASCGCSIPTGATGSRSPWKPTGPTPFPRHPRMTSSSTDGTMAWGRSSRGWRGRD